MSVQSQRSERGYALIEAMVGGAVLMVALGSVLSGMLAAREHVARSVVDQHMTQHLVHQAERIRALPPSHLLFDTSMIPLVNPRGCLLEPGEELPVGMTCGIFVFPDTDTAVGGAAGPLTYKRAVVKMTFAGRSQYATVMK
ncbi:MAG TPA: hypothetical protein VK458_28620 [Myxococcaceae bacterium]|nr:hypothetical protein [Myxococcaceae bacterium]